jgi:hypothetical protein
MPILYGVPDEGKVKTLEGIYRLAVGNLRIIEFVCLYMATPASKGQEYPAVFVPDSLHGCCYAAAVDEGNKK